MKFLILTLGVLLLGAGLKAQDITSLYTDIKAHQVGDVLSVIVAERTNANRESKSTSQLNSQIGMEAGSKGNISDFLPVFGGSGTFKSKHNGQDGTSQADRLTGRLSVRIVKKLDNGMFEIKGERKLNVNGEENLMKLHGYVRPRDITAANTIYSYNIADAQIVYRKSGLGQSFIKTKSIVKFITFSLAGLMVAASTGYFMFK